MGQQSNKVQKRRRRVEYKKRLKAKARATAVTGKAGTTRTPAAAKA